MVQTPRRFLRSPDGLEDGDVLVEDIFGFPWLHAATVVEQAAPLDEDGLIDGDPRAQIPRDYL